MASALTKDTLTFDESAQPIALWGTSTTSFFQGIGAITVDPTCVVGTEIIEPSTDTVEDTSLDIGVIIGVSVAAAVIIIIAFSLTAFCCYKKRKHNMSKTGVEVITVTKSRSE